MSNPSRIAMLAQIRSDLFDEVSSVSDIMAGLDRAKDFRHHDAEVMVNQLHDDAHAIARLILSQRPASLNDVASIMHCISDATDRIKSDCEDGAGKLSDISGLADLIELATSNIIAFLAPNLEPRNSTDTRRTALAVNWRALAPLSNQVEA